MKNIMKLFVLVAAAAMALTSCQTQEMEDPTPTSKEYEYVFLIGNAGEDDEPETSATIGENCVEWQIGDKVGTFNSKANNKYSTVKSLNPATISVYAPGDPAGLTVGDMLYFYYPWTEANDVVNSEVPMNIPVSQDGVDDMPLVSLPFTVTAESTSQNTDYAGVIRFANLGSVIEFNVYSTTAAYQTELIKSVEFKSQQAIAGDFTFDLTTVDYSNEETLAISGYEATSVISTLSTPVAVPATKDAAKVVKMVVAPGEYTGKVVVTTDKATYTYPISSAKEFKRSAIKSFGLDLREEKRTVITTQNHTIQWNSANDWTESCTKLISGEYTVNTAKSGGQTAPTVNDNNNDCRVYAKGTVTVSYSSGNMQRLVFNLSDQGKKRLAEITPSVGNVSVDKNNWTVTWEGNSKSVVFTVGDKSINGTDGSDKAGQLCFNSIDVVSEVASTPSDGTLVDLEITGMTTMFVVGSEFVFDGKAYAVYSDDEKKDVTNSVNAILSDGDMSVVGSKTVTITYVEDDVTVSSEYLITVSENVADYSGTYAIVAFRNSESYYYYLTNEDDGADTKRLKALVAGTNKPEDDISLSATKLWNVAKSGNAYTLQSVDSEKFVSWSSGNSALMAEEGLALTIEKTEDKYTFKYVVSEDEIRYLSLNSSKGNNYFAMYTGSQSQELYLIPAVKGEEVQPTVVSIEITDYTTSFTQGDTFDFGGKVIATLSNGVKVDVTESATFSGYNMETVDVQTVTVTYEGKTQTYDITVTEKTTGEETFEWVATESADLKSGDQVVIVSVKSSSVYAMSNDKGTSSAPDAVAVTVSNNKLSEVPDDKLVWSVEKSESNFIFHPVSDNSKWLYCTAANNGLRVGTNTNKTFVWDSSNYLKHNGTDRYIGVYNNQDWRCYTTNTGNSNIAGQSFQFFVKSSTSGGETPEPDVPAEPVKLTMTDVTCYAQTENSLTFTWDAVTNAIGYKVTCNDKTVTVNTTEYTVDNLTAGTQYTISIIALGDGTKYSDSDAKIQVGETNEAQQPDGGESNTPITVSKSISEISGTTNDGTQVSTMELDNVITASASTGGNNGKVYEDGAQWRLYQSNKGTVTVSAKAGYIIKTVKFTYTVSSNGVLKKNNTDVKSGSSDTVNASSVTYSVGNTGSATNGQVRITKIEVVYQAD